MLKTEGEARGFQHFPADIKSVTSLLLPFLKQYRFSNKNQFKLEYERGVFRDIAAGGAGSIPGYCCRRSGEYSGILLQEV